MVGVNEVIAEALRIEGRGSQQRLADALGVAAATVSRWVKGKDSPEPTRWSDIEVALALDPGTLSDAHREAITLRPALDSDIAAMLLERLDLLDAEMQRLADRVRALEQPPDPRDPGPARQGHLTSPTRRPRKQS